MDRKQLSPEFDLISGFLSRSSRSTLKAENESNGTEREKESETKQ